MSVRRALGLAALVVSAACATVASERPVEQAAPASPVYGALPLRSLADEPGAGSGLMERLTAALDARGARFVPADAVEDLLVAQRVRITDSVSARTAGLFADATQADYLVLGTLFDWRPGPEPRIALALRVIDTRDGSRALSRVVSLRGGDFAGLLDLGAIEDVELLADEVVARLLDDFDDAGRPRRRPRDDEPDTGPGGMDVRFVREGFDLASVERLAVLPLANRSGRQEAGLLYSELLGHAWFDVAGIDVVERSELIEAMVAARVRSVDDLDLAVLADVGRRLGTRWFMLGSLERYVEERRVERDMLPELEASVRIVDVESGRTVAAAALQRRGDDYHHLLGLGTVRDGVQLVARSAAEIVAAVGD